MPNTFAHSPTRHAIAQSTTRVLQVSAEMLIAEANGKTMMIRAVRVHSVQTVSAGGV